MAAALLLLLLMPASYTETVVGAVHARLLPQVLPLQIASMPALHSCGDQSISVVHMSMVTLLPMDCEFTAAAVAFLT